MNEKNPSEEEEYAELFLGYEKVRSDPTILKFPILHNHWTHFSQEPESQTYFFNSFAQL